ncbi:MAG: imidazole glycerol phosphate synthase cyclase subunit [Candidatus Hydrogenedentota bacterium]
MALLRLIARLDIKSPNLIKTIQYEGLRVMGAPHDFALKYYHAGADEIIYMDIVASLYGRNHLTELLQTTAAEIFIPITVGGGVRSVDDARALLRAGADKVAVNTAATKRPELIKEIAETFGSQCMVLSIEAKRRKEGGWEAFRDNGRERTGLDAVEWAGRAHELGAGEILLTSVDREGTRKGYDIELLAAVTSVVPIPVIAGGGMGTCAHIVEAVRQGGASAVAMADVIHYDRMSISQIRSEAAAAGLNVRKL